MPLRTSSFTQIQASGEQLRSLLNSCGIAIHPRSVLGEALDNVEEAVRYWRAQLLPTATRTDRLVADLMAIHALGPVVDTVARLGLVPGVLDRLRALACGDPRITLKGEQSQQRDAIFELITWHITSQFADDVEFAEPDIRCTYREHRFGIACKAHYGQTSRAVQAIRKGWRQVLKSPVEYGVVLLHMTNHFPHQKMSPRSATGDILGPANEATMNSLLADNLKEACDPIEEAFLRHLNLHSKPLDGRFHGTLYAAHTLATYQGLQSRAGGILYQGISCRSPQVVWDFIQNINAFWQDLSATHAKAY